MSAAPGNRACLLLGSNIRPEVHLPLAIELLRESVEIRRASSVWETPPVGSEGANFLNAAILVDTPLDAVALKEQVLTPLEARLGRVRTADKNAARTIDLDLVVFNGVLLDPSLWEHAFRAVPMAELLPGLVSAGGESLRNAALRLAATTKLKRRHELSLHASRQPS